jgi:hypothetical protein
MGRVDADGDVPDDAEEARAPDVVRDAWNRTVEDVRAMARDREAAGYETLLLFADDTTPEAPGDGDTDRWGLTYLVGADAAERFRALAERTSFDETAVYQRSIQRNVFVATECIDVDARVVLFVAGVYRVHRAGDLARAATDRGRMWTRIRELDGTVVGAIEHDDAESFFPNPERFPVGDSRDVSRAPDE